MKKKILLSVLLIIICTFTACGKKDRKDIDKDLGGNTTENTGTSEEISNEEIPEHLSYTAGGITVDAEVSASGYGQVPVYKLKKKEKNDDWIRSYAEVFFDGGEYENVKPYHFCSKAELEAEKEFWEEELSELTEADAGYRHIKMEIEILESEIERAVGRADEPYAEDKLIYENDFSGIDEEDFSESHTEYALLRGNADGDVWQLVYDYREYVGIIDGETYITRNAPVLYGICLEKAKYYQDSYGIDLGIYQNSCSRATAEADAEELLDRLGFDNMELVYISELNPQVINQDGHYVGADYCDGYGMVYAPVWGGLKPSNNMSNIEAFAEESVNSAIQPCVIILVNSEGVFSFCIMEDYEIEEKLTEHSSILTFEQIDSIAKEKFGVLNGVHATITDVNFGYMCITYDGTSYAMVPVWSYCMEYNYMASKKKLPLLTICALDGTVIVTSTISTNYGYEAFIQ